MEKASFTIHASGADRLRDGNDPIRQFPGLEKYEATDGPAESRQRNFRTSFETIEIALEVRAPCERHFCCSMRLNISLLLTAPIAYSEKPLRRACQRHSDLLP